MSVRRIVVVGRVVEAGGVIVACSVRAGVPELNGGKRLIGGYHTTCTILFRIED